MNIIAKLYQLLTIQKGVSKNGQWRKQDIIVETIGQYPKKIYISIWGDNINENHLVIGNHLDISFELESREFNSKWYTDVKALEINLLKSNSIKNNKSSNAINNIEDDDILPF